MTPWPFYTPWNALYVAQICHTHSDALEVVREPIVAKNKTVFVAKFDAWNYVR